MAKFATLKSWVLGSELIAHNRPYEFKDVEKNPSLIWIDGICYDKELFDITETDECRILKGSVETVEECLERIRATPLVKIAEELVQLKADFHTAVGESVQTQHNLNQLVSEISKSVKTYGI